jgi:hypothetical protein
MSGRSPAVGPTCGLARRAINLASASRPHTSRVGDEFGLDGFVPGPDPRPDNGQGTGGEALDTWAFSDDPEDRRLLSEGTARSGAVILGRRLFDVVDGPNGWDDTTGQVRHGTHRYPGWNECAASPQRDLLAP